MSPYRTTKLKDSIVVFIDVLGFSDSIMLAERETRSISFLKDIKSTIKEAKSAFNFVYAQPPYRSTCAVKFFTDNVVIGVPFLEGLSKKEIMRNTLIKVAAYQCDFVKKGLFVRGSISVGPHFMDSDIVFGPALIEAHCWEKKACYPRIAIAPSAEKYLNPQDSLIKYDEKSKLFFVNYLDMQDLCPLKTHRDLIQDNLLRYVNNKKVYEKYSWTKDYHNNFCQNKCPDNVSLQL